MTASLLLSERKILEKLCSEVATPVAYKAGLLLAGGRWDELVSMKIEPSTYSSAECYLRDAQVVAFLKKHPAVPTRLTPEGRRSKTVEAFFKAESQCYKTNGRLIPLLSDPFAYGEALGNFIVAWRKEIKRVLRRAPVKESLMGKFGPGATFSNKGDFITIADKLSEHYTATRLGHRSFSSTWDKTAWSRYGAAGLAYLSDDDISSFTYDGVTYFHDEHIAPTDFQFVNGNRFTVVPKTALIDRGICIEPSLNVYYQLGVGSVITRRLFYAYLWDKKTCQDFHRELAQLSSLTGTLATIDLSSASDTVAKALVKLLLPQDWYDLLYQLRCHSTFLDGKWYHLEKFSSMGNGFTFELETLIFFTLAKTLLKLRNPASQSRPLYYYKGLSREGHLYGCGVDSDGLDVTVSVFGDDIIVPTWLAEDVVSALKFFGFSVNPEKTFLDGPFRESCGGDFFHGFDVRPHFQKAELDSPGTLIALHNGLKRFLDRDKACSAYALRGTFVKAVRDELPTTIRRCSGPQELGDLVLRDDNPRNWDSVVRSSIRYLRVWRPVANRKVSWAYYRRGVVQAVALYRAGTGDDNSIGDRYTEDAYRTSGLVPRVNGSYVSGYRFGRVAWS